MLFVKSGQRAVNLERVIEIQYEDDGVARLWCGEMTGGRRQSYRISGEELRTLEEILRVRNEFIDLALPFSPSGVR